MDHQVAQSSNAVERYLLNELAAAERDEFETHFFDCADCAADVRILAPFTANLKAQLRQTPVGATELPSWLNWLGIGQLTKASAWLAPALAALSFGGFWFQTWRLNAPLVWSPQAVAALTRGTPTVVEMTADGYLAIALDLDAPQGTATVEVSIEDSSGAKLATQTAAAPRGGASLNFGLRKPGFGPGKYVAVIRTAEGKEISRHPFDYVRASRRMP